MKIPITNAVRSESRILVNEDDILKFKSFFINELKEIYWAEKAYARLVPKMIRSTTGQELAAVLTSHMKKVVDHVIRLEDIFATLGRFAEGNVCEAMSGLIIETERVVNEAKTGPVKDIAIVIAFQKMQHYKIATYGSLCSIANTLEEREVSALLYMTLNHEKLIDEALTEIAESIQMEMGVQALLLQFASSKTGQP